MLCLSATVATSRVSNAALGAVLLLMTTACAARPSPKPLGCFTMKEKPTVSLTSETMNPTLCAQSCAQSQYVLIAPSPDNRLSVKCACASQIPTTPSQIPCNDKCPGTSTTAGITCGGFDEAGSSGTIGWSLYPPSVPTEKSMKVAVAAPAALASPPAATSAESRPPFEPIFEPNAKPQLQAASSLMNTGNVSSAADASLLAPPAVAVAVARPEISSAEETETSTISEALAVAAAASATKSEPAKPSEPPSKEEENEQQQQQQQTRADIKKPAAASAVSNNAAVAAVAAAAATTPESVVKQVEQFVATPTFLASAAGLLAVLCGVFLIVYRRRKRQRHEKGVPPLLPQTQEKKDNKENEPFSSSSSASISRGATTSFKDTAPRDANCEAGGVVDLMIQNGSENVRFGSMRGLDGSNSFKSETFGRKKAVDELSISVSQAVPTLGVLRNNIKGGVLGQGIHAQ
ncbi:hypothetical protein HDU80_005109 [Chytriomyces hyalinus]|nr:hypothetical protein HDU80_005109 [Chytriomyces hyalinus]